MNEVTKECRLCGSTGPHRTIFVREMMFGTQERFEYCICATCETLQIVNVLEGEELARHYPQNYYSFNAAQPRLFRWLIGQQDRYRLGMGGRPVGALLTRPLPDGILRVLLGGDVIGMFARLPLERDARILDVGCGNGALLDRLAEVGFTNLSGVDPFIAADSETPQGIQLMKAHLIEVTGEFDLIMFNHSLEHVPNPVAMLKAASEKLDAKGICLARTPTTSSEAWTTYAADWVQIDAPRHFVIPSRQAMRMAAESAGLRVEQTFDDSNLGQFMGSEAYRRGVAVTDPKILRMFGPRQIWEWEKRADRLNRKGRGDQAGFVLRAK
ncbi:class I SAM-dependent methyltransferase [Mycolicibacterium sp. ND9-15]|uniref:class I SAM-dependent methyltransferase n=1 Tax=Mycolicibacterium sp. ND9-15 TaxID=3042320 RepID=UPI002DDBC68B|nr:class I SAM-dependent methyltransferase [Mycolicibacterium sp. ND9-15]WSE54932.1 class I SAM-dependent methyltransferase [Mycolicibacterium sp. ND9-15]